MADRKFPPRHGARHGAKTIRQFCAKWRQWHFVSFRRAMATRHGAAEMAAPF